MFLTPLLKALKDVDKEWMDIEFRGDSDSLTLSWFNDVSHKTIFDRGNDYIININGEGRGFYAYSYLSPILKGMKGLVEVVKLELGDNIPIRITADNFKGLLEYYFAPKITT